MSRVIVHASRYDELLERARALAQAMPVRAGMELRETGVGMGAMVSHKQRDRALGMVQAAKSAGGQIVAGGDALESSGAFLQPTVIGGV